ncbi:MAG: hypothetical protein ABJD68_00300 [Nakamurella sp.]
MPAQHGKGHAEDLADALGSEGDQARLVPRAGGTLSTIGTLAGVLAGVLREAHLVMIPRGRTGQLSPPVADRRPAADQPFGSTGWLNWARCEPADQRGMSPWKA